MARKNIHYRPGKAQARMGLVVGGIFILIGLCVVIPTFGPFGLLWTGIAIYNTVINAKVVFGSEEDTKDYFGGYVVTEEEPAQPAKPAQSADEGHDHIPSMALDAQKRLEQLESLKTAGLITEAEYQEKRREILEEL